MLEDLRPLRTSAGAIFDTPADSSIPISYRNDTEALQAAHTDCALLDRSHWGRIQVEDADRIRFLHNQSTNNFEHLQPGQGCDTVFVTSTARTIDLVTAYVLEDTILLLVSPQCRQPLLDWLERYIFFADKVTLNDVTLESTAFSLIGPNSQKRLKALGIDMAAAPHASHALFQIEGIGVRIAAGSGLALPGYTLIVDTTNAAALWQRLTATGAVPLGERVWEQLRITQGRPRPGHELTDDYNPLEAGLWRTISFEKGCYIGQETIARLETYKGVKQHLWGIRLNTLAEPGSPVTIGNEKVGTLTSITQTAEGPFGLAYIRSKVGGKGLNVTVKDSEGTVVDVPFLSHERLISAE